MTMGHAGFWQLCSKLAARALNIINRVMLQPGIPLLEIMKKVLQGLMWSFSDLEKWKMKWDQYVFVAEDLLSDPCRPFRTKAGMRSKSELKSHG